MKRNLDLMREILLMRENSQKYVVSAEDIDNENLLEVNYNISLLSDAGYIVIEPVLYRIIYDGDRQIPAELYGIIRLTNSGHDYLDSVRDPKIYNEVKSKLKSTIESVPLEVIVDVAKTIILKSIGL